MQGDLLYKTIIVSVFKKYNQICSVYTVAFLMVFFINDISLYIFEGEMLCLAIIPVTEGFIFY